MRRLARFLIPVLVAAGLFAAPRPALGVTITVDANIDSINNDTICTLREAVISANTGTPPATGCVAGTDNAVDTISIPLASPQLGIAPGAESQPGETGDLDVTEDLIITGAGVGSTSINGAQVDRVFEVIGFNTTLTVEDLAVRSGAADESALTECRGGAFRVAFGTLVLNDVLLANNVAGEGAAIYADGSAEVTLNRVEIDANQAHKNGGAIMTVDSTTLMIDDSVITDNNQIGTTQGNPPCAGIAPFGGGALYLAGTGGTSVSDTTIARNTAVQGNGGGLFLFASGGSHVIERSTISDNAVSNGHGAAARIGSGSTLDVTNSTISGNTGVGVDGLSNGGTLTLNSTTTSDQDFGVANDIGATTSIGNSIIDDACFGDLPVSLDHNVESGNTCAFGEAADQPSANPDLEILGNYGGPTQTHKLGSASDALDAGDCDALDVDQRGVPRPQGSACDVGPFESAPPSAAVTFPNGAFTTASYTAGCTPSFQDICGTATPNPDFGEDVDLVEVRIKRALNNQFWNGTTNQFQVGEVWNLATGDASWTLDFAPGVDDVFEVSVRATDEDGYLGNPTISTFAIDNVAPAGPIIDSVSASRRRNKATFTFHGAEPGGTLQCQRDGRTFLPCTSPLTYKRLKNGRHTFNVRQIDAAGNVGAVTSVSFRV